MTDCLYGIYGASGLGRQIMPLARLQLADKNISDKHLVFIDDNPAKSISNNHNVLSFDDFLSLRCKTKKVNIAVANGTVRQKLADKLVEHGIQPWSVQDRNVIIMDDVSLGDGYTLSSFVLLTSNIRIGNYFQANHYSHVAHDCVIGDFVTLAPGVRCNGNVHIEDHAYIGTGAILRQGTPDKPLRIGRGAVVGMGAVVTKDVPAGLTVVGNPARPLVKK